MIQHNKCTIDPKAIEVVSQKYILQRKTFHKNNIKKKVIFPNEGQNTKGHFQLNIYSPGKVGILNIKTCQIDLDVSTFLLRLSLESMIQTNLNWRIDAFFLGYKVAALENVSFFISLFDHYHEATRKELTII